MQSDMKEGWGGKHGAPAAEFWHCPECKATSPVKDWAESNGDDSRQCPACGFVYVSDFVVIGDRHVLNRSHSAGRISQADPPKEKS